MVLLRKIEHCVNGVQPAWEETFMNWNSVWKNLASYPKAKAEDGQMEPFHRSMGKRRASHQNSEHELEVLLSRYMLCSGCLRIAYQEVYSVILGLKPYKTVLYLLLKYDSFQ